MDEQELEGQDSAKRAIAQLDESFYVLFDRAPVMMHSLDRNGTLVRVNRRWSDSLGYETTDEVMGRKAVDFLTEQSRERALNETLPLFWRVGHARSVGYRFVRKDGRVVGLLLDAEAKPDTGGTIHSYAAMYDHDDTKQWQQAANTLRALNELTHLQQKYQKMLIPSAGERHSLAVASTESLSAPTSATLSHRDALATAFELAQDISLNLRSMVRVQEEWLDLMAEREPEMLLFAKSSDKTLAQIADALAAAPWMTDIKRKS